MASLLAATACTTGPTSQLPQVSQTDSIRLVSPAFTTGSAIPARYTCDGPDVSPPLSWSGGPPAEEYALIVTDPDAQGGEFVHWVVYAIPSTDPPSFTGRCRNPWPSITSSASCTEAVGPMVVGSRVIQCEMG